MIQACSKWASFARRLGSIALLLACSSGGLLASGYRFVLPSLEARPGASLRYTIQGDVEEAVQGFSLAIAFPAESLALTEVHIRDTILEAMSVDYLETKVSATDGTLVIGMLVDAEPPFTGALIPSLGFPIDYVHLQVLVADDAEGDLVLECRDGLSIPPTSNLFSVDNQSIPITEPGRGVIALGQSGESASVFLRGDVNSSGDVDVSDPIAVLSHLFSGGARLRCDQAADANDDEAVDLSDSLYLLSWLFSGGPAPPPPWALAGKDPTKGTLGCES
jgi:hypothetical protein